jgi:hypothetical protein
LITPQLKISIKHIYFNYLSHDNDFFTADLSQGKPQVKDMPEDLIQSLANFNDTDSAKYQECIELLLPYCNSLTFSAQRKKDNFPGESLELYLQSHKNFNPNAAQIKVRNWINLLRSSKQHKEYYDSIESILLQYGDIKTVYYLLDMRISYNQMEAAANILLSTRYIEANKRAAYMDKLSGVALVRTIQNDKDQERIHR